MIPLVLMQATAFLCLNCASAAEPASGSHNRPVKRFDLQAHRGGAGEVTPGNTLPAFEHAMDLQVTTLEMDVHSTNRHPCCFAMERASLSALDLDVA